MKKSIIKLFTFGYITALCGCTGSTAMKNPVGSWKETSGAYTLSMNEDKTGIMDMYEFQKPVYWNSRSDSEFDVYAYDAMLIEGKTLQYISEKTILTFKTLGETLYDQSWYLGEDKRFYISFRKLEQRGEIYLRSFVKEFTYQIRGNYIELYYCDLFQIGKELYYDFNDDKNYKRVDESTLTTDPYNNEYFPNEKVFNQLSFGTNGILTKTIEGVNTKTIYKTEEKYYVDTSDENEDSYTYTPFCNRFAFKDEFIENKVTHEILRKI